MYFSRRKLEKFKKEHKTKCFVCSICGKEAIRKYCKKCRPWVNRLYNTKAILHRYGIDMTTQEVTDWLNEFTECIYCRQDIEINEIAIDHILPKSRGGLDKLSNLQVIHKRCNMIKGSLLHEEFIEFLKALNKLPKETQKIIEQRLLQSGFMFRR